MDGIREKINAYQGGIPRGEYIRAESVFDLQTPNKTEEGRIKTKEMYFALIHTLIHTRSYLVREHKAR